MKHRDEKIMVMVVLLVILAQITLEEGHTWHEYGFVDTFGFFHRLLLRCAACWFFDEFRHFFMNSF